MTNKIVLRTVEEFMNDYVPVYTPFYALFLKNSQAHSEEVGQVEYKRVATVGDIRMKHITPKDTEMKQIAVGEGKKTFKKYFLAKQYIQSKLQKVESIESIIAEVLDENQKLADELFLLGEGTAANNVVNNGLYWSADDNYVLKNPINIAAASTGYHLPDMHTQIMATVTESNQIAGEKVLVVYGTDATAKFNGLYANSDNPFKDVLAKVMGPNWSIVFMPPDVTPASADGWIAVNLDQIKVNYTALPKLDDQGFNAEKKYTWHNFLMGSMMVDVKAYKGIIRQPVEFA